ncbi:glutathione S-transferase family protein [Phenylobacterium terrae]|uniref:Glutathione S-transferase family protein n=1 Tax=Phenylobacterium terrae TaxID=2665495 RepID=A0ABW4N2Q2_9CAUL
MKLYWSETLNPRKVCAVARHLEAPVAFVHVDLAAGGSHAPDFLARNPNGKVPVLEEADGRTLWESNAIMCRLSEAAGADLWPRDERQIDLLRWLFWDAQHFGLHASRLYFENIIRPKLSGAEPNPRTVADALGQFRTYAAILDDHLAGRSWVMGDQLTLADFALGVALPYAEAAQIPLGDFPAMARWHDRLNELPAWREPFPAIH